MNENGRSLQFVFALGVEQLVRPVVIRFGHEHFGGTIQVAVIGQVWLYELLRRGDTVFLQHHHEHLGVNHRPGIKKFHTQN